MAVCSTAQYFHSLVSDLLALVNSDVLKENGNRLKQQDVSQQPPLSAAYVNLKHIDEQPFMRLREEFMVSAKKLRGIVRAMMKEMREGLANDKNDSPIKMLPSYFTARPRGDEVGSYYSLDVGGTNFRVCEVMLEGGGRVRLRQHKHVITQEMKAIPAEKLFDKFAQYVLGFLRRHYLDPTIHRPLGLTFSFPVEQTSLNSGTVIQWNKGFTCPGAVGNNVSELVNKALKRNGVNMSISALVNDTVGTLISHAYSDPQANVAVVLGTGSNAAYFEDMRNITKFGMDKNAGEQKEMIINTEWGGYDDTKVLPIISYDILIDKNSVNPGKQIFEKLISGMYLGEIVRYVINDLHSRKELFKGNLSDDLRQPYAFDTAYMSRIERDHSAELLDTRTVLESVFNQQDTTYRDRSIIKHVCQLVAIRSARLSAAGIAAIVTKINRLHDCTVVVDGSLFEGYPHFANRVRDTLYDILGASSENIILDQAKDGSGRGSAIAAALLKNISDTSAER